MQESRPAIISGDQAGAWGLLRSIELHPRFDELTIDLRSGTLDFLGVVAGNLAMYSVAMNYRKKLIEIGKAEGYPDETRSG